MRMSNIILIMSLYTPMMQAAVFLEQGKLDEAIAQCEEAVQVGRANRAKYEDVAKAYVRMAKACLKKDDLEAALTAFRQAQVRSLVGLCFTPPPGCGELTWHR